MQNKYDIIIIGSGLGGLTCGYILAKNGFHVGVFDQGAQPGGCLQTFIRKGVKFETGVHYIGSMNEGQPLNNFFHYLRLFPDVKVLPLDPDGFDVVSFRGQRYRYASGYENFIETLSQQFPGAQGNLKRYAAAMKEVAQSSPFHSMNRQIDGTPFVSDYTTISVNDFIAAHTSRETLQNVLAGMLPLYAGVRDRTPLYVHAFINDSNISGACRIMGGSDAIASSLVRSIRSFGGEVFTRSRVVKIECDNTRATAIHLADGMRIGADQIISNTHPEIMLEMIDSHLIRPMYRNRIKGMTQTVSNFTVYLKFRPGVIPYMNHNYYHYNGNSVWGSEQCVAGSWPHGYMYMHLCPETPSPWAQAGELITFMRFDEVAQWANTRIEQRGAAYREFKQRRAEIILAQLERDFPGTLAGVEEYWTSSPLTYLNYTGTKEGAAYGILRDINMPRILHRTRIPNLLLTGQNTNAHGIMGVIIGSLITCSELIGRERMWREIASVVN